MSPLRGLIHGLLFPTAHAVGYVDVAAPRLLRLASLAWGCMILPFSESYALRSIRANLDKTGQRHLVCAESGHDSRSQRPASTRTGGPAGPDRG